MSCPRCQMPIANPDAAVCPHCGYALRPPEKPSPPDALTPPAPQTMDAPFAPPPYSPPIPPQMPMDPFPGYGAPPSGSLYGPDMPPSYSPYPPYPTYPPYGAPAPGTTPLAPYPAWAPAPPAPPSRNGVLVSVFILLVVAFVAASGTAVYLALGRQSSPSASAPSVAATATATAAATATPRYTVLFQDPMTSNINGWTDNSYCHFASDGYHVTDRVCYAPTGSVSDFDLTISARQVKGSTTIPYGVVFRRTSRGNYYVFQIDSSGRWDVLLIANNSASDLISGAQNPAMHDGPNVTNVLEVRASGAHFTFYINATYVSQMTDSTYASGLCGVLVYQNAEAVFTNLTISVPSS